MTTSLWRAIAGINVLQNGNVVSFYNGNSDSASPVDKVPAKYSEMQHDPS
jgi:hypothetical protein